MAFWSFFLVLVFPPFGCSFGRLGWFSLGIFPSIGASIRIACWYVMFLLRGFWVVFIFFFPRHPTCATLFSLPCVWHVFPNIWHFHCCFFTEFWDWRHGGYSSSIGSPICWAYLRFFGLLLFWSVCPGFRAVPVGIGTFHVSECLLWVGLVCCVFCRYVCILGVFL